MSEPVNTDTPAPMLKPKVYDAIKFLVQVFLPAFATFYFALGSTWNLPNVEQTIGTLAAVTTFLGVLLKASKRSYDASGAKYDGQMVISINEEGNLLHTLELNSDPEALGEKKEISFKVVPLK